MFGKNDRPSFLNRPESSQSSLPERRQDNRPQSPGSKFKELFIRKPFTKQENSSSGLEHKYELPHPVEKPVKPDAVVDNTVFEGKPQEWAYNIKNKIKADLEKELKLKHSEVDAEMKQLEERYFPQGGIVTPDSVKYQAGKEKSELYWIKQRGYAKDKAEQKMRDLREKGDEFMEKKFGIKK